MKKNFVFKVDVVQGDGDEAKLVGTGPANAIADSLDEAIETIKTATIAQLPVDTNNITLVFNMVAITIPAMGYANDINTRVFVPNGH